MNAEELSKCERASFLRISAVKIAFIHFEF
jgi:hypothetical protein